jgi:hypothetical protein
MENRPTTPVKTEQAIQPVQLVTPPQAQIESPSTWMRQGDSPAEIILAVAFLIGAIAGLLQVLVPVMLQQPPKKTK